MSNTPHTPPTAEPVALDALATVPGLAAETGLPESSLRWLLFHRETNGLTASGAVIRLGRRLYLDRRAFGSWLASRREVAAA